MNLEFFSCSGGMAEGFKLAGISFDLVFDKDTDACDSYHHNLGQRPIQMDVRDLLRMAELGWNPGPVELLVADPPCTPWSRAGKLLGTKDPRDALEATCRLIALLRPSCYLIGNVPGLEDAPNNAVVRRTISALASEGYCTADFAVLDVADFGVPQHRIRPFWFGHRSGPCIRWPNATHGDPAHLAGPRLPGFDALPAWVTCREALSHLSDKEIGKPVKLRWRQSEGAGSKPRASVDDEPAGVVTTRCNGDGNVVYPNHRPTDLDEPAKTLTANTHSDGALLVNSKHPPSDLDAPSMAICARDRGGAQGGLALVMEWPWDAPATTLQRDDRIAGPSHHTGSNMSTIHAIKISEKAAAILQGFPDRWLFSGKTKKTRWSQIGQAMPPPLARAVALSVRRQMREAGTDLGV